MEEVWRQSWVTIDVEVKIPQNSLLGLTLKEVSYIWANLIRVHSVWFHDEISVKCV